jgi:DNA-binding transcriptional LysR family regulator
VEAVVRALADLAVMLASESAKRLFLSQPTLSHNIKKLYTERAYISLPRNHVLANRESVVEADLVNLAFSIESGLLGYSDWFSYILRNAGVPDDAVERRPFKEHLRVKDTLPTCNLITSLIMGFVRTSEQRAIIAIDEPYAKRNIGLLYRPDASEKVLAFAKYMKSNGAGAFSGNAFIPYFLFPEEASNLAFTASSV